ncbi:MAG TPA: putative aminohydrolase SsnA [Brevefilum fermentans]|jgi:putative selenium metabolism protein SsnA|uniref:Putative hydrolase n=1 Tax=Candidatus Brevifilum fermentans TaxID=1986204 RepID=A0A1Y6K5C7_9CHLR|nr:putative aminohydrolase SsnA [Brevefilum fermentans]OQB87910.1 MAG: 8-oxoguanine deaminase [Chloroflexi bacterium ADurb.Bin120]SMX54088.1 putative hydrolase [Brevefilum fermentans]HOM67758.1 putative aminohydrolase SsnA [Brevefilum fermentans]HQA27986.1 putative aminohydrolase SsnA [Brevefilum fermentans]
MLITNGKLIPWGSEYQVIPEGLGLLIRDGVIQKIAPQNELIKDYPDEEILDAGGQYVMPGNICAHTHFYGAFSRGLGIPGEPASTFTEILEKLWWNLDKALDEDGVRYSALVCLVDAIKHGTTTLIDHHASPNAIDGSLDIIAETINQAGLRASLCYEVTDRDGAEKSEQGLQENLRFIKRIQNRDPQDALLRAHFGLHASLTLSDETLSRAEELCPAGIGFHIHAAEGMADQVFSLETSGKRVVHRLDQFGILRPESILAHGVHLDQGEIERLAETQTWLTHQPRSNMNNAVGVAPIEDMLDAGMRVGMGNDGFSNTMWLEWKEAYLLHKLYHRDPRRMGGYTVTRIAVDNNAALVTELFDGLQVGQISEGAAADLIFVDYHPFTPLTGGNLPWHILFGFQESMVTATIVAGKPLMYQRQLLTLDESAIAARALEIATETWKRFEEIATQ